MEQLLELAIFIVGGGISVFLLRLLQPNTIAKQNHEVTVKVDALEKKNDAIKAEIQKTSEAAKDKIEAIEAEKQKEPTNDELTKFFNERK